MVVARNIQNKNITTTIGTITLGLNNMFVFETFVEHHLELTLGTSVQFKPLQGQIILACNRSKQLLAVLFMVFPLDENR